MLRAFTAAALRARRTAGSRIVNLLIASVLVTTAACSGSDSSTGPSNQNPVGNYPLAQVDKKAVPFVIYRETGFTVTVLDGNLELYDDGSYFFNVNFTDDIQGEKSPWDVLDFGTYQIQGNNITFEGQRIGPETATLRDGVITVQMGFDNAGPLRTYAFRLEK